MIEREIRGDSGLTKLKIQVDGDEASVLFRVDQGGAIATFLETVPADFFIDLGQTLSLDSYAESDSIAELREEMEKVNERIHNEMREKIDQI